MTRTEEDIEAEEQQGDASEEEHCHSSLHWYFLSPPAGGSAVFRSSMLDGVLALALLLTVSVCGRCLLSFLALINLD